MKLKLKINRIERLKPLDLTMVVSTMADTTDQVDAQDFCQFYESGIVAQYTMPGTPRQNGIVERRNHTLKNMVRSMIAHTTLPQPLWSEVLKTVVYLLNRVPSKIVTKILYVMN